MSVVLVTEGRDPQELIRGHPGYGLVRIPMEVLEELEQEIVPSPTQEEPDHVLVRGRKSRGRLRRISRESVWDIEPPAFP